MNAEVVSAMSAVLLDCLNTPAATGTVPLALVAAGAVVIGELYLIRVGLIVAALAAAAARAAASAASRCAAAC